MFKLITFLISIVITSKSCYGEGAQLVTLSCGNAYSYKDFYVCNLDGFSSSSNKAKVTSSNFDVECNSDFSKKTIVRMTRGGGPEYFPEDLGKFIKGVATLVYAITPLKYIKRSDFTEMGFKLREIEMYSNKIEEVPYDAFYDLPNLEYINLSFNNIKNLAPNLLVNSKELLRFEASGNQIAELPAELFKNNLKIENINLQKNKIKRIIVDFSSLMTIKSVSLEDNIGECNIAYQDGVKNIDEFQEEVEKKCR